MDDFTEELDEKELDKYFFDEGNTVIALALLELPEHKKVILEWLEAMYKMNTSVYDKQLRNRYLWFLLLQLEMGSLVEPFTASPPKSIEQPISEVVAKEVYVKILKAGEKFYSASSKLYENNEHGQTGTTSTRPHEFMSKNPNIPSGFACYGSVFSNQN